MSHEDARWQRARREEEQREREAAARERRAVLQETARYQVLAEELESLRRDADAESISAPRARPLRAGTSSDIALQNADLQKTLAHTRASIQIARASGHTARQLQEYFAELREFDIPRSDRRATADPEQVATSSAEPVAEASPTPVDSAIARADAYVSRLTPGVQLSEDALALIASLSSATPEFAAIAVRELQVEISRLNREAKDRDSLVDRLRELDVRARALGDTHLVREVLIARGEQAALTDERLNLLDAKIADGEEVVARAERAEDAEADRKHVQNVLRAALVDQGYEVVSGFESAIPKGGLLLRRPGYGFHAVQATVDAGLISMDVVRTALEADLGASETRDYEAHVALHADMRMALDRVQAEGVELGRIRELEPGDIPIPPLATATPVSAKPRMVGKPKERGL